MELTDFTLRILLIFIPGIISLIVIQAFTVHKEIKPYKFIIYSLLLGFISYFFYYIINLIINTFDNEKLTFSFFKTFFKTLFNKNEEINIKEINVKEIISVSFLSVIMGCIYSFLDKHKIFHRMAQKLHITKKFGDLNVWSYLMNSKLPEWVRIIDIKNDLTYEGWVHAFSDATEPDEIFLRDVKVYQTSISKVIYETPALYLAQAKKNYLIEFPLINITQDKKKPKLKKINFKNIIGGIFKWLMIIILIIVITIALMLVLRKLMRVL